MSVLMEQKQGGRMQIEEAAQVERPKFSQDIEGAIGRAIHVHTCGEMGCGCKSCGDLIAAIADGVKHYIRNVMTPHTLSASPIERDIAWEINARLTGEVGNVRPL